MNRALDAQAPSAAARGLQVDVALDDATVPGDARLISRLVSNLVDNAIRYNITGGRVVIKLAASTTEATLTVTNTGPPFRQTRSAVCSSPSSAPPRTAPPARTGSVSAYLSSPTSPKPTGPASKSVPGPKAA